MRSHQQPRATNSGESGAAAETSRGFWTEVAQLHALSSPSRRRQFYRLLALMLLGTVAELATIGAVVPFVTALAAADQSRLLAFTALFVALVLLAGAVRLQLAWMTRTFVAGLGQDFAVEIQRRTLDQPYSFHIGQNSSRLIAALDKVQSVVSDVLLQLMQGGIALFTAVFIVAALIAVDPVTASVAAAAFAILYALISAFTAPRLARNSETLRSTYDRRVKIVQESLGGIRDVIIDGSQHVFVDTFERVNRRYSAANATTGFFAAAPRFVVEAAGTVLIALIAFAIARRDGSIAEALPTLGALAVGAQRLLPLVQQVYSAWSNISGRRSVLGQVLDLLNLPLAAERHNEAGEQPLPLRERIMFDRVSFAYPGRRSPAVDQVSLEIPRGARIGLIGRTGSGKSTLADLLMGLLDPTEGRLTIDGVPLEGEARRRWQRQIAHVPQSIFLSDSSIAANIAFGLPEDAIDMTRVIDAAKQAQLHDFVEELADGYGTVVGERGVRLSGGQRQRLGIARAIYKQAPVLILDEATSALDEATEAALMESLLSDDKRQRTMVIIAHRPSTIAHCDTVARLEDGRIAALGSFADVVGA